MTEQDANHPETWVTLAHLLRPQGRKGELLADLHTDFPERFADRRSVSLRKPNGSIQPATIESHWLPVGKNAGRVVLKLQGIDSINDAELLAGFDVVIPVEQRAELEDDEQYITDLLDCTLVDKEHTIGLVEDVHFPTNTAGARLSEAAPLLVVRSPNGDELLIPFAKAWIESIDLPAKRIQMHLPDGLLEING
ncbi:ribosome maturation factor RimM [Granulicella arctica]|uniref:Ribosome maturation factor RimM n=1 Tax=Granulicella arctica TaxID=940613 RepID=A0A7Y9THH5_9BACT|nr:ribosome maturation factor RimM [Granulicella arctica]NYF80544.1 16S rRNA processing protein RimM [Granulicella arctica]